MTRGRAAWLCVVLAACALGAAVGYKVGVSRAFLRDRRAAEEPEFHYAKPVPLAAPAPAATQTSSQAAGNEDTAAPAAPFALDMSKPVRLTWPLDVGPDPSFVQPSDRPCLRARQGVNELQEPGAGVALYPFRIRHAGTYDTWFRVRWLDDQIGSMACNNSWFAGVDHGPAVVVGNKRECRQWYWQQGPSLTLAPGTHWLRVELREDGALMDRVVVAPAGRDMPTAELDRVQTVDFWGFAGERPPFEPQRPIETVEWHATPTGSLVVGSGHLNEITLCASWQGGSEGGVVGRADISCPSAEGFTFSGDAIIRCGPSQPFVRRVLPLTFPPDAHMRVHRVTVRVVARQGRDVFLGHLRFAKGYAWAFLGPFRADTGKSRRLFRSGAALGRLEEACDHDPRAIAMLSGEDALGLGRVPLVGGQRPRGWRIVADGSCYAWTGAVDLRKVYGFVEGAFAYAVTWVRADTRLHHRSFTFQGDDSGWLWINGRQIANLPVDLPREANRLWTSAALNLGPNPVVVKLTQNQRYWGFRLDVVDWHWQGRRGDVVRGMEPAAWPAARPPRR